MKAQPEPLIQPVLEPHLQAAFDDAWHKVCAERPSLALLPQPNHLTASLARALQEAASNGVSSHEELVAAALRAMPWTKPPSTFVHKAKERETGIASRR